MHGATAKPVGQAVMRAGFRIKERGRIAAGLLAGGEAIVRSGLKSGVCPAAIITARKVGWSNIPKATDFKAWDNGNEPSLFAAQLGPWKGGYWHSLFIHVSGRLKLSFARKTVTLTKGIRTRCAS